MVKMVVIYMNTIAQYVSVKEVLKTVTYRAIYGVLSRVTSQSLVKSGFSVFDVLCDRLPD